MTDVSPASDWTSVQPDPATDWRPTGAQPKTDWKPVVPPKPTVQPETDWGNPSGHRPAKWLYGVGPNNVMGDYQQTWSKFGAGGIRPGFRSYVDQLGDAGFSMGVYDFDRGHHFAPNDPHLDGRAVDVDSINGESVGTKLTPKIGQFITTALALNGGAEVGVPKEIYNQLPPGLKNRAFVDNAGHVHVQLNVGAAGSAPAAPGPEQHMTVGQLASAHYAGYQLPTFSKPALTAWAHKIAEQQQMLARASAIIQRTPINEFLAVVGSLQRGVGMTAYGLEHGHDPQQLMRDVWSGITNLETSRHATDAVRSLLSVAHLPGGATQAEVKQWVDQSDIPKDLRPYISNIINTSADFTAQTISDPWTYVGGLGLVARGIDYGIRGLGVAARSLAAIDDTITASKGIGKLGEILRQPSGYMATASAVQRRMAGDLANKLGDAFKTRPDLHDFAKSAKVQGAKLQTGGLTAPGHQGRIGIENSELKLKNDAVAADQEAARHPAKPHQALAARTLHLIRAHGVQADSDVASKMLGAQPTKSTGYLAGMKGLTDPKNIARDIVTQGPEMTPNARQAALDALEQGRNRVRQYQTAARTHAAITAENAPHPDWIKPGSSPQTEEDWRGVAIDPKRSSSEERMFASLRELQRANVMVFPFAHGIGNVGQLTYLRSPDREALPTVISSIRYMLGHVSGGKIPGSLVPDEATLTKYGGAETYVHEHEAPGLWAKISDDVFGHKNVPGIIIKNHIIRMQGLLHSMETGWRQGLWDALERNAETKRLDPHIRGAMVAERAGDPRNIAQFVRSWEILGGPFVAYRLGIVPKAVAIAIRDNPQRVLAAIRPPLDIQNNRSRQAQNSNTLMVNDPVANAAKLFGGLAPLSHPLDPASYLTTLEYITSPSTMGAVGFAMRVLGDIKSGMPPEEAWVDAMSELNPAGGAANALTWAWEGIHPQAPDSSFNQMPGQKMSFVDGMMGALMAPLASYYFMKAANPRYMEQMEHRIQKATGKYDMDLWQFIHPDK